MLTGAPELLISEIHFEPLFGDNAVDQYFEVRGAPNATISSGTYLVVVEGDGDGGGPSPGEINSVFDLGGLTLGSNGFLVVAQSGSSYPIDPAGTLLQGTDGFDGLPGDRFQDDASLSNRFEFIFGSNSFMLIESGVEPLPDEDVDSDDDGTLDGNGGGWNILDGVSVLGTFLDGSNLDVPYGNIVFRAGTNAAPAPEGVTAVQVESFGYVARVGASTGWGKDDWVAGETRELTSNAFDFELDARAGNEAYRGMVGFDLDHVGGHNFFSTLSGTKFYDSNGNGVRNGGEPAEAGATVYIDYNDNGTLDNFETVVEPDDFADGTILTNAVPGVTLTVSGDAYDLTAFDIESETDTIFATTGTRVFSHGTRRLTMDFLHPVQSLSVDFSSLSPSSRKGILEAYDASGTLLETYTTATLIDAFETMTITRPSADIAFAYAYPDETVSPFGYLDNLRFTRPEPSTVTDSNGNYQFDNIADHLAGTSTLKIREVGQANHRQTVPGGDGGHSTLIDKAIAICNLDFGGESSRPLDIIGRIDNGEWWTARSDATAFSSEHWGGWSPSVPWEDVLTGDVDGDGNSDVIGRTGGQLWVSRSNGENLINEFWGWLPVSGTWNDVQVADVNGDGFSDVVGRHNGDWWVARSNGSNGFVVELWGHWADIVWNDVQVGDFNGDGMDDIAGRTGIGDQWWLAKSDGTRFLIEYWSQWASVAWNDVNVGDYNGDGNDDLAGRAGDFWYVAISDGTKFNGTQSWGRWTTLVSWDDVQVADFDWDGNDDVAGRVNGIWYVGKSNGNGFNTSLWGRWSNIPWADVRVADFDGDGKDDIAGRTAGDWWLAHSDGSLFSIEFWGRWSDINWSDVRIGRFGAFGTASQGILSSVVSSSARSLAVDAVFASQAESRFV